MSLHRTNSEEWATHIFIKDPNRRMLFESVLDSKLLPVEGKVYQHGDCELYKVRLDAFTDEMLTKLAEIFTTERGVECTAENLKSEGLFVLNKDVVLVVSKEFKKQPPVYHLHSDDAALKAAIRSFLGDGPMNSSDVQRVADYFETWVRGFMFGPVDIKDKLNKMLGEATTREHLKAATLLALAHGVDPF